MTTETDRLADAIDPRIQQSRSGKNWHPPTESVLIAASDFIRSHSAPTDAHKKASEEIAEFAALFGPAALGKITAILARHFPSAPTDRYAEGLEAAAKCVDDFDNEYNRKNHAQFADDMRQLAAEIRALKGPTHE